MDYVYSEKKKLHFYNCDENGHLSIPSYLSWCAEIAGSHLLARGISRQRLLEEGKVFLLTHVSFQVLKPLSYQEEGVLKTWEGGTRGVQFLRNFALADAEGNDRYQSASSWVLVDPQNRKILRPSQYGFETFPVSLAIQPQLARLKLNGLPQTATYQVPLSKIDSNHHMGNQFYAELLMDFAPVAMEGRPIVAGEIVYSHEAKKEEAIHIHTQALAENRFAMYGVFDDGRRCFEAAATVE